MYQQIDCVDRAYLLSEYDRQHIGPPGKAREIIEAAPSVDAVCVTRCKDCFAFRRDAEIAMAMWLDPNMFCALHRIEMAEDAFCSYGRKEQWISG